MSIHLSALKLPKENFLVTDVAPIYISAGPITANDVSALSMWFEVTEVSAGVNAVTPGVVEFEYSPDDLQSWYPIINCLGGKIEGIGSNWSLSVTGLTPLFPPIVRVKFTAPAGESYRVKKIRRIQTLPGDVFAPKSPGSLVPPASEATVAAILSDTTDILADTGAIAASTAALTVIDYATETTSQAILADTTALVVKDFATEATSQVISAGVTTLTTLDYATETTLSGLATKDFALEATQQKLREWPYASYTHIGETWDSVNFIQVFTYYNGAAVVGTITLTFTDGTRGQLATPVGALFAPVKDV